MAASRSSPVNGSAGDDAAALLPKAGSNGAPGASDGGSFKGKPSSSSSSVRGGLAPLLPAILYGATNLGSVVAIVLANKVVMTRCGFTFPVCLTWFHSIVTAAGMMAMAAAGMFSVKRLPAAKTAPVAAAYAGFVVFNNLSIQVNTVGFYQISKIMIAPVVVVVEYLAYRKTVSRRKLCAIGLLLVGIAVATLSDAQVSGNPLGIAIAALAVLASALYQVWAGAKQAELGVSGNQLLHQVSPIAVALLGLLIPLIEPLGLTGPGGFAAPGTILGFSYSRSSVLWILLSSCLGLLVTLSTYLFIGATSALTYNVVGHLKTVFIVTSGVLFFGDAITAKKAAGIAAAMAGIVWYTWPAQQPQLPPPQQHQSAGRAEQQA